MKMRNIVNSKTWLTRLAVVVFWCGVWFAASYFAGNDLLLPSPIKVVRRFGELILTGTLWSAVWYTALKIMGGFLAALLVGVLLAVLSGTFEVVCQLILPFMSALKSVPVASFVILALMCFGSSFLSVFIAFVMVLPVIYIGVLSGIRASDEKMLEMAKVFRVNPLKKAIFVYLPSAFPYFRSSCQVALGLCWKAGVAAELIGIPRGSIGEQLYFSKIYFQMADLLALTVVIVLLSAGFEKLFMYLIDSLYARYERM